MPARGKFNLTPEPYGPVRLIACRTRRVIPMLQHLSQRLGPLGYTCCDKLSRVVSCGLSITPCAALRRECSRVLEHQIPVTTLASLVASVSSRSLLFLHLDEN